MMCMRRWQGPIRQMGPTAGSARNPSCFILHSPFSISQSPFVIEKLKMENGECTLPMLVDARTVRGAGKHSSPGHAGLVPCSSLPGGDARGGGADAHEDVFVMSQLGQRQAFRHLLAQLLNFARVGEHQH